MRTWMLPAAAGALVVALIATSVAAVAQTRRLSESERRGQELAAEVAELREEVRTLEAAQEDPTDGSGGPDGLSGLLDGDLSGLLDAFGGGGLGDDGAGLFDGLLGGAGSGMDGVAGAACLLPPGDGGPGGLDGLDGLGGLLDGLGDLGGNDGAEGLGGLLDGLGDLGSLGDLGGVETAASEDPDEVVATIADQVAELRELAWDEPVEMDLLDDAALRARLDEILAEDLDEEALDAEARLLETLGALPAGTDLVELQRELLGDQVAGFYAPETGELVVRVPDDGTIRPADRVTIAHELDHALTDQALGLPDRSAPPYDEDPDASLGALGLIEGDATLLMQHWAGRHLTLADQLGFAMSEDTAAAQAALEEIPVYLQRELLYPYTDGLDWACDRWLDGGWAAIDAAYSAPPTTSHEVLFGEPVDPAETVTTTAPDGYRLVRDASFGAAPLLWLFEAPGDDEAAALDDARERAAAWRGGTARVWADGPATAVGLSLVDGGDGPPLCGSVRDWYTAAFPGTEPSDGPGGVTVLRSADHTGVLRCDGPDVVLAIADDLATATHVAGS